MLEEHKLEEQSAAPVNVAEPAVSAGKTRGVRQWLLGHYRFLYAADLILLYLSSMFCITARIVTGASSAASRTLLVIVIGSGILAALPFVTGENFERDFVASLANPGSKKVRRVEIIVGTALLLILVVAVAVAILHPTHAVRR